ncbi:MAG: epoxyqueuosine reductase QueH, partial [Clostridia bacterium]|nr:epoxyqueuosine reductase QueH [Clostridia bacterium]
MKLLLHTCCGPCMTAFNEYFVEKEIEYSAFFYNPNIHPYKEYLKRRDTLSSYANKIGVALIIGESFMQDKWERDFNQLNGYDRCSNCYGIRLSETAKTAAAIGFTHFTSTLLVSPYQKHELIKQICLKEADKFGIEFFYEDFRTLFRKGQDIARQNDLYRQKYCGCFYSLDES